jgi:hypothetical protein
MSSVYEEALLFYIFGVPETVENHCISVHLFHNMAYNY